jgi:hypothetical protein
MSPRYEGKPTARPTSINMPKVKEDYLHIKQLRMLMTSGEGVAVDHSARQDGGGRRRSAPARLDDRTGKVW